jgi:hypothetical protein
MARDGSDGSTLTTITMPNIPLREDDVDLQSNRRVARQTTGDRSHSPRRGGRVSARTAATAPWR